MLRAVQAQTGASVELAPGVANERIVAQLGPGKPKDILATLLNGSNFDYMILGVPGNSGDVQKLILSPRQNASPVNTAQNVNPQPMAQPPLDEEPEDEVLPSPETTGVEGPPPQGAQEPQFGPRGTMQTMPIPPPGVDQPTEENNGQDNSQQQVKTPEQLLQELQRMQQQQQQMQQQLNPANQGAGPGNAVPQPQIQPYQPQPQ